MLGAASKALATIVTQPLIVAKVRLQSKPPPERNGVPFRSFTEVLKYTIEHEGLPSLFKGIGPQLMKGLLVQGFLMMTKERYVTVTIALSGMTLIETGSNCSSSCFSGTCAKSVRSNCRNLQISPLLRRRRSHLTW